MKEMQNIRVLENAIIFGGDGQKKSKDNGCHSLIAVM
jgi:hypothetical protein